jgi:hypothetical protein
MAMPIHLSKSEFAAVAAHAGIRLDEQTLTDYFELYIEHVMPMLARLRSRESLESEVRMPAASAS